MRKLDDLKLKIRWRVLYNWINNSQDSLILKRVNYENRICILFEMDICFYNIFISMCSLSKKSSNYRNRLLGNAVFKK